MLVVCGNVGKVEILRVALVGALGFVAELLGQVSYVRTALHTMYHSLIKREKEKRSLQLNI